MKITVKIFSFALAVLLLAQTCLVSADTVETSVVPQVVKITSLGEYDEYLSTIKGELSKEESIYTKIDGFTAPAESTVSFGEFSEKNAVMIDNKSGTVNWEFTVPKTAFYEIKLDYAAVAENENNIEAAVKINGAVPFSEAENIFLPRVWVNEEEIKADADGNESTPAQVQKEQYIEKKLTDVDGLYLEPLRFYFTEGKNTVSLSLYSGKIALSALSLEPVSKSDSYKTASADYADKKVYDGKDIVIQAQDAIYKSSKELRPISDKTDPAVTPSSAFNTKINSIGGNNWDSSGEKITWKFTVPEDALYIIAFNYRQDYLTNASSIRALEIDGKSCFSETDAVAFPYVTDWKIKALGEKTPYKFYLTKGEHTISLSVSLGEIAEISRELENLMFKIGELYRKIIMITGTSPDANRDYRLSEQIPTLNDDLIAYKQKIDEIVDRYNALTNAKGGSNAVTLETLGRVLERMQKSKFNSHEYVGDLFNNYSGASAWVYEMRKMPLDIEKIIISGEKENYKEYTSNFWQRTVFAFQTLLASFVVNYDMLAGGEGVDAIDVWVNLGRDQANVLSGMVEDTFTPKTGINVNVKIATASMIQAKLSGSAPDCTIMQERTIPVNLAMRGALYDLSTFDDFDKVVMERYHRENIVTPYKYKDGVYGLPDTETYPLMYIRNDVFEQFALSVPKTWEEFMRCAAIIMRNNLAVGIPQMYTTFLYQFNGQLYNEDLTATALQSAEAYSAFEYYCDLYCEYKLPTDFSFYNRFRTGEMPLGIAPHTDYATLMAAAPEITGKWSVHAVPGMEINGKINSTVVGGGSASIILKDSKNPKAAWEFLKWWTDADTQYRYSSDVESIAGIAARHSSANINTLSQMSWGRSDVDTIIEQYMRVEDLPEVPGGYYLTRAINNAFYSVYSEKQDPKKSLRKQATMVDEEMTRKIKEYS